MPGPPMRALAFCQWLPTSRAGEASRWTTGHPEGTRSAMAVCSSGAGSVMVVSVLASFTSGRGLRMGPSGDGRAEGQDFDDLETAQVRLRKLGPLTASSEGGSIIPMAGASLVTREPIGVVAAFPAYNFAFPAVPQKVGPALIAGCTAVVKVTEPNPLATFIYGEICEEVGLPPGVINIVAARAPEAEYLVRHPGVDMVSFTGSVQTGSRGRAAGGGA